MNRKPFNRPPSPGAIVIAGEMIVLEHDTAGLPPAPYVELLPSRGALPEPKPAPPAASPDAPPAGGDAPPPG
jgi:hypothetical protein